MHKVLKWATVGLVLIVCLFMCMQWWIGVYLFKEGFPLAQLQRLERSIGNVIFWSCLFLMALFCSATYAYARKVHLPIQYLFRRIQPFQQGHEEVIPSISLTEFKGASTIFHDLASTFNAMSDRLQCHINHITEERNEKAAILESLGEGVLAVDAKMCVSYVNSVGAKMLRFSRSKLMGTCFSTLSKLDMCLLEKCHYLLKMCQEKSIILTDSISIGEDKKIYFEVIAAPKARGNGAILLLQDKSSHHKVLEMGRDFVANASHELRTPITIIRGFIETLQDLPELPREMVADIIEKIVRNCQRMDTLVKNLLTLADLENLPESRFQRCDIVALSEACRQVVLSVYEKAEIAIEKSEESAIVFADPDILELAIINLLDNAAKYSNPPAQIAVSICQEEEEVKIAISDRGIGIPPADQEHIFERFYTVDKARSRRLGGAGLGLSIVRTIIEKHNGSISVESAVGSGTTFFISLPARKEFIS